ncbi:hypothetical protein ACX4MT_09225 [Roseomonas mucosa]
MPSATIPLPEDPGNGLHGPENPVSVAVLADHLGITPRSIREWAEKGVIPRTADGKYPLRAAVRAYCAAIRSQIQGGDLKAERHRLVREQADREALRNARLRGELLPAAEVEAAWSGAFRNISSRFLALPSRISQRLGTLSKHDLAEIDREIRDTLAELGNQDDV